LSNIQHLVAVLDVKLEAIDAIEKSPHHILDPEDCMDQRDALQALKDNVFILSGNLETLFMKR
jgi:hypothetical protein